MTVPSGATCPAAAVPMAPKMPAPITAPIASMTRSPAPSTRLSARGSFSSMIEIGDGFALEQLSHGRLHSIGDRGSADPIGSLMEYVVACDRALSPSVAAFAAALSAQAAAPFNESIRLADLKADLYFLAGDGFKGRLVGTPENALAAEFVRSRFERAGLEAGRAERRRSSRPRS